MAYTQSIKLPLHGLRSRLLVWGFQQSYPLYAKLFKRPRPAWQIQGTDLLQFPPGSLGRRLGQFLQANKLDLLPGFENHDIAHVLLAYETTAVEEVCLQWCLLGNGKRTPYCIMAALVGALCFPEHWGRLQYAWRRGQQLNTFHHWYFEYLLRENLSELQAFLRGEASAYSIVQH